MADPQPPGPPPRPARTRSISATAAPVTGDHHRRRAVDRGEADLVLPARQQRQHLRLGRGDGDHRPAGGQRLHQPAAGGDQPGTRRPANTPATWAAASSPIECPASTSGAHPERRQQPEQGDLEREQRRLGHPGLVQQLRLGGAGLSVTARRTGCSSCGSRAAHTSSKASANTGNAADSSRPIPSRWLPCPVNRNAVRPPGPRAGDQVRRQSPRRPAPQAGQQLVAVRAEHDRAVLQHGPPGGEGPPTSAGSDSGRSAIQSWSRSACARRASSAAADTAHGRTAGSADGGADGAD